jgi:hypothetical protein
MPPKTEDQDLTVGEGIAFVLVVICCGIAAIGIVLHFVHLLDRLVN